MKMKFNLSRRQWVRYVAVPFWLVVFILNPVLPRGNLQWFTDVIHNVQMVALWIALFYGTSIGGRPKEEAETDEG